MCDTTISCFSGPPPHRWRGSNRLYLDVSPKALRRIREELRRKTRQTWLSLDEMIAELNPYIRGGPGTTFFGGFAGRRCPHLDGFTQQRLARWWATEAWALPAGLVPGGRGGAPAGARSRTLEPSSAASPSRCSVRPVNVVGSRMRETRTYGLTRGCWPVRPRTAGWGLLHHFVEKTEEVITFEDIVLFRPFRLGSRVMADRRAPAIVAPADGVARSVRARAFGHQRAAAGTSGATSRGLLSDSHRKSMRGHAGAL